MAKWLDDFLFYLPGFASVPIVIAGMLALWLAFRLVKSKKKPSLPPPAEPPAPKGLTKPQE